MTEVHLKFDPLEKDSGRSVMWAFRCLGFIITLGLLWVFACGLLTVIAVGSSALGL